MRFLLISVLIIVLFTSCRGQNNLPPSSPSCILSFKDSLRNITEGKIVDFEKVSCVEWNEVLFIECAFEREQVEKRSGVSLPAAVTYSWSEDGEGHNWYILFVNNKKVTGWFSIGRDDLDFSNLFKQKGNDWGYLFINRKKSRLLTYYTGQNFYNTQEKIIDVKLVQP